jgi:hypothetical protein
MAAFFDRAKSGAIAGPTQRSFDNILESYCKLIAALPPDGRYPRRLGQSDLRFHKHAVAPPTRRGAVTIE